jgi:hypothetical protein
VRTIPSSPSTLIQALYCQYTTKRNNNHTGNQLQKEIVKLNENLVNDINLIYNKDSSIFHPYDYYCWSRVLLLIAKVFFLID